MFAVIFEVQPIDARRERVPYLDLAKAMKPKLDAIDGFLDIDRLASRKSDRRMLSLSTWRDEKAVVRLADASRPPRRAGTRTGRHFRRLSAARRRSDRGTGHPPQGLGVEQQRFDETGRRRCEEGHDHGGDAGRRRPDRRGGRRDRRRFISGSIRTWTALSTSSSSKASIIPGTFLLLASWRDAATRCALDAEPSGRGAVPSGIEASGSSATTACSIDGKRRSSFVTSPGRHAT